MNLTKITQKSVTQKQFLMGQTWYLFVYYLLFSRDKYSTYLTTND